MSHPFELPIDLPSTARGSLAGARAGFKRKRGEAADSHASSEQEHDLNDESEGEKQDEEDEQPPGFPHVPLKVSKPRVTPKQRVVKRRHYYVLSAILHRCLLGHDFERAKKAFALLLRFEIEGKRADLRRKRLWGIGAELLLQHPTKIQDSSTQESEDAASQDIPMVVEEEEEEDVVEIGDSTAFTQEGFEAARRYYERLILQYPYQQHLPQLTSSQTFYPAMYTMWIFQIQAQRQKADRRAKRVTIGPSSTLEQENIAERHATHIAVNERLRGNRTVELNSARELRNSLGDVMVSPPYDRDIALLKLQAKVECWIADLIKLCNDEATNEASAHLAKARELYRRATELGAILHEDESELLEDSSDPAASETPTESASFAESSSDESPIRKTFMGTPSKRARDDHDSSDW